MLFRSHRDTLYTHTHIQYKADSSVCGVPEPCSRQVSHEDDYIKLSALRELLPHTTPESTHRHTTHETGGERSTDREKERREGGRQRGKAMYLLMRELKIPLFHAHCDVPLLPSLIPLFHEAWRGPDGQNDHVLHSNMLPGAWW